MTYGDAYDITKFHIYVFGSGKQVLFEIRNILPEKIFVKPLFVEFSLYYHQKMHDVIH